MIHTHIQEVVELWIVDFNNLTTLPSPEGNCLSIELKWPALCTSFSACVPQSFFQHSVCQEYQRFLQVNRFLSYNMQQIRGRDICNETCLGITMQSAALPLYGRRPRELALMRRRWSYGILRGADGKNGKRSSCPSLYGCVGTLHVFRANMGKPSLNVRGHLFTQAYLQNGYCVLSPVWSAKEAARLTRTLRCWDSFLGFLNSRFVASFCRTLHFVKMADSRSTWSSSTSTFHVHIKPLVVVPHFTPFMSLKVQYVRAVVWGDLDKNRRLFRM